MKYIVCNIDANYVRHCAAMLASLFAHSPKEEFTVYILAMGVPLSSKELLAGYVKATGHQVVFIDIDKQQLKGFPMHRHDYPSLATYLRLFIPRCLPSHVDKALYADCDLVFCRDVSEIYDRDISSYTLAAVEDAPNQNAERLQYDPAEGYFNAGLMLLNVARLRQMDFTEKALAYLRDHKERIVFHDQDVMNALLHGTVLFLPLQWNLLDCYYRPQPHVSDANFPLLRAAKDNPAVVHFSGPLKPWHYGCHHPLSGLYFDYAARIPWGCHRKDYLYIFRKYKPLVALLICRGYTPYEAKDIRRKLLGRKR